MQRLELGAGWAPGEKKILPFPWHASIDGTAFLELMIASHLLIYLLLFVIPIRCRARYYATLHPTVTSSFQSPCACTKHCVVDSASSGEIFGLGSESMAAESIPPMFMLTSTPGEQISSHSVEIPPVDSPRESRSRSSSSHNPRKTLPDHSAVSADSHSYMSLFYLPDIKLDSQERCAPDPQVCSPTITGAIHSRSTSAEYGSRPGTSYSLVHSRPPSPSMAAPDSRPITPKSPATVERQKLKKGNAWYGGRKKNDKTHAQMPVAWIAGHPEKSPYDVDGLLHARPEIELCNQVNGNCFVHLWDRSLGKGASFKVDATIFAASPILTRLAFGDVQHETAPRSRDRTRVSLDIHTQRLSLDDLSVARTARYHDGNHASKVLSADSIFPTSNGHDHGREVELYLPLKTSAEIATTSLPDEVQRLIDIRNFFAFLSGQSLVATERKHSFFDIFTTIASYLRSYGFSNLDGSTFGEVANGSFEMYIDELQLTDMRQSREKTIEGIVLGEHMKSVILYNEAFTHGVGKYHDMVALRSPKFELISRTTQNRLVHAVRDLEKRTAAIREILTGFNFPSLFSGIMNSKMSEERKEGVRFEAWKESFLSTRKYFLSSLQQRYGHWPPKARSKKNNFETSGLNRVVLVDLYEDLASLYDLLVDRQSLTSRTVDGTVFGGAKEEPTIRALRTILSEYDRSSPPVKPPIPFDIPLLPKLKFTRPGFGTGDKKLDAKITSKKIKGEELHEILCATWHSDMSSTPFVDAFRDMEKRAAHGCNIYEIQDLKMGQWIFLYAVLQALPMLTIDAPGIIHNRGVEYFLCEPPRNGVPWVQFAPNDRAAIAVGDGSDPVSLLADLTEPGIEGLYRRSHCWQAAEEWTAANPILNEALKEQEAINHSSFADAHDAYDHQRASSGATHSLNFLDPNSTSHHHLHPSSSRDSSPNRGPTTLALPVDATWNRSRSRSASPARPASLRPRTPVHEVDASKTFDAILADVATQSAQGKMKSGKKGKKAA
nr:hypothetical protein CFP56_31014 [Quercus suber]